MLIFLDLETTGLESTDKICSIALVSQNIVIYELINEGKKISAEASSIHHITNEDITDANSFLQSDAFAFLEKHNSSENTLIAHNIEFDTKILASHGFLWQGAMIDTLRVSKHLLTESEGFSLQFLRYDLKLYKQEKQRKEFYGIKDALCAHNALEDTIVTQLLFETLLEICDEERMVELSYKPVLLQKFPFGKYKGKYIEEVCMNDRAYVEWLSRVSDLDDDMKYSIDYFLQG